MGFWDYLAEHPWWALIYLILICFTIAFCATARTKTEPDKEEIEDKDKKGPRPLNG